MILYPAIDIKDGKCVRLLQGRAEDVTVYGDDPALMAERWISAGAQRLHVVDLDGAFTGEGKNLFAVERIVRAAGKVPVQLGGGIRSLADIERRFELGVARVILGTAAISSSGLVEDAALRFPGRIVAGIDAKDGFVAVRGWVETTRTTALELANRLSEIGVLECVFTDIARDGMLGGVSLEATREMVEKSNLEVIASGGVSSLEDLENCRAIGCSGAIIGKAMYDGRIDLAEAIRLIKTEGKEP